MDWQMLVVWLLLGAALFRLARHFGWIGPQRSSCPGCGQCAGERAKGAAAPTEKRRS